MGTLAADFGGLTAQLFELVQLRATGTLFVVSADNHAAQVVLSKGQLLGIAYNGLHNENAVAQLASLAPLRFSFTPELIYPLMETLLPDQAEQLLERLGYRDTPAVAHPLVEEDEPTASVAAPDRSRAPLMVYRGRVIQG